MTDADPWEHRFLDVVTRATPIAPPPEAFLFRRAAIARCRPDTSGAALLTAVAELLAEEGMTPAQVMGCLRAALVEVPARPNVDWFWDAGRGDLMPLADPSTAQIVSGRCRVARLTLPIVAALTASAIACRL